MVGWVAEEGAAGSTAPYPRVEVAGEQSGGVWPSSACPPYPARQPKEARATQGAPSDPCTSTMGHRERLWWLLDCPCAYNPSHYRSPVLLQRNRCLRRREKRRLARKQCSGARLCRRLRLSNVQSHGYTLPARARPLKRACPSSQTHCDLQQTQETSRLAHGSGVRLQITKIMSYNLCRILSVLHYKLSIHW